MAFGVFWGLVLGEVETQGGGFRLEGRIRV